MKRSKDRIDDSKSKKTAGRRRTFILAAAFVVVIGIIAGVAIYRNNVAPFEVTVLEVNDTSIKMRYFLKRVFLSSGNPLAILETLANEEIVKQMAPQPPYNITITEEDIDLFIREVARGESESITESEFKAWYRQQLNDSRFTDAEYRDLMLTNLLSQRLSRYLAERVPTVAEQVHLYMITQRSFEDALRVKERLDAGEDFFELARDLNLDEQLKAQGGDLGWYSRGSLSPIIASAAFDELDIGQASDPLLLGEQLGVIVMVSERAAAKQIEEEALQIIKARALAEWVANESKYHKVKYYGFNNGYDLETDSWVKWQLQKMRKQQQVGDSDTHSEAN